MKNKEGSSSASNRKELFPIFCISLNRRLLSRPFYAHANPISPRHAAARPPENATTIKVTRSHSRPIRRRERGGRAAAAQAACVIRDPTRAASRLPLRRLGAPRKEADAGDREEGREKGGK